MLSALTSQFCFPFCHAIKCPFKGEKKLSACRGEGSAVGLQLRVRFVPAALLAMLTFDARWVPPVGGAPSRRTSTSRRCVRHQRCNDWVTKPSA
jgi:hypothetical protein